MKIASVGSCFAQHVGGWLSAAGYRFLSSKLLESSNSSFATGNIYTPRALTQWLEMSKPNNTPMLEAGIYEAGGVWYDLLRPTFRGDGFPTLQQLLSDRADCVAEILETICELVVYLYAGVNRGLARPKWSDLSIMPGIICGEFNDQEYQFHNTLRSSVATFKLREELLGLNPGLRIL